MADNETTILDGFVTDISNGNITIALADPGNEKIAHCDYPVPLRVPAAFVIGARDVEPNDNHIEVKHSWITAQPWFKTAMQSVGEILDQAIDQQPARIAQADLRQAYENAVNVVEECAMGICGDDKALACMIIQSLLRRLS